jgi:phenylalanine-4-hydroxylase
MAMRYGMHQDYQAYTKADQHVWQLLFDRQAEVLPGRAASAFLKGIDTMQFRRDVIPDFNYVNEVLANTTGWQIEVVPGLIPDKDFFELMAEKRFPSSTWLRQLEQLDYLEEPDMFHDCFAHMPLLTDQYFVDYLQELSKLALKYIDHPLAVEVIGRLYWFTVEFGLIEEMEGIRIYGAGILSSAGESVYCLDKKDLHRPLDVPEVMNLPYYKDHYQNRYYVISSYKDLFDAIPEITRRMGEVVNQYPADIHDVQLVQLNLQ